MELISLTQDQVPSFLKNSQFYREQTEEDENESIFVDSRYFKSTGTLCEILQMCNFWNVDKIPDVLIEYIFSKEYDGSLYQEIKTLPFSSPEEIGRTLRNLKYCGDYKFLGKNRVLSIVYAGDLNQLKTINLKKKYMKFFAKYGYLDCLKYAHLKFLKHCTDLCCPWDTQTCTYAAKNGHLDCLKYAHENGYYWDSVTCNNAAAGGHLECLMYSHEQGCSWDEWTCAYAAKHGHLKCLMYAHENGCPWDVNTCVYASRYGHLECLTYAQEHGCPQN